MLSDQVVTYVSEGTVQIELPDGAQLLGYEDGNHVWSSTKAGKDVVEIPANCHLEIVLPDGGVISVNGQGFLDRLENIKKAADAVVPGIKVGI